jgi:hypothetical protein
VQQEWHETGHLECQKFALNARISDLCTRQQDTPQASTANTCPPVISSLPHPTSQTSHTTPDHHARLPRPLRNHPADDTYSTSAHFSGPNSSQTCPSISTPRRRQRCRWTTSSHTRTPIRYIRQEVRLRRVRCRRCSGVRRLRGLQISVCLVTSTGPRAQSEEQGRGQIIW